MISPVTYIFVQSKDTIEKNNSSILNTTQITMKFKQFITFRFLAIFVNNTQRGGKSPSSEKKNSNTEECIITVLDFKSHEL